MGEKFLKMEASSKSPTHPTPINLFAFFFKKKKKWKKRKKDQKKKKKNPAVCLYPSPSTRKASLGVRSHAVFVAI